VNRLIGNADLRERFGERAVEAREQFSMEKITFMWEEPFEEAVK
jgi:hypothetical protein